MVEYIPGLAQTLSLVQQILKIYFIYTKYKVQRLRLVAEPRGKYAELTLLNDSRPRQENNYPGGLT